MTPSVLKSSSIIDRFAASLDIILKKIKMETTKLESSTSLSRSSIVSVNNSVLSKLKFSQPIGRALILALAVTFLMFLVVIYIRITIGGHSACFPDKLSAVL
jgi:hypothetical protein